MENKQVIRKAADVNISDMVAIERKGDYIASITILGQSGQLITVRSWMEIEIVVREEV